MNEAGNPDTLIRIQAGADARTKGRNGGIKSGQARRKKASIRRAFEAIAGTQCQDKDTKAILQRAGLSEDDCTVSATLAWSMIQAAMGGSAPMMRLGLSLLGEEPSLQLRERQQDFKERLFTGAGTEPTTISVSLADL